MKLLERERRVEKCLDWLHFLLVPCRKSRSYLFPPPAITLENWTIQKTPMPNDQRTHFRGVLIILVTKKSVLSR